MSVLTLQNYFQSNITLIENEFIDKYMAKANGEYVKVYLLLLRHINKPDSSLSISQMADCLENTEGDIIRALKYWEKAGLLTLQNDSDGNIIGIDFGHGKPAEETAASSEVAPVVSVTPVVPATPLPVNPIKEEVPKEKAAHSRKELKQLLFIAEQYLGKTLTRTDVDAITYFYDTLGFSADLIEYLIEYCVENGHKSMHYIQKVALSWSDAHITTVEQARNSSALYNRTCYSILNAFGIKGRGPATSELEYIKKWTEQDGFDLEIILEACSRTVLAIHQPSFEYADRILQNWLAKKVRNLNDIRILDSAFELSKAEKKKPVVKPFPQQTPSKFRNFEERSYDMDALTKELLQTN